MHTRYLLCTISKWKKRQRYFIQFSPSLRSWRNCLWVWRLPREASSQGARCLPILRTYSAKTLLALTNPPVNPLQNPALCFIGWIALVCGCCGFMIGFGIFPDFFYSDIRIWICRYYPEKMKKRTLWKTVSTRNISGMFMVLCTMYQYYVAKIRTRETSHKTTNLLPSLLVV